MSSQQFKRSRFEIELMIRRVFEEEGNNLDVPLIKPLF